MSQSEQLASGPNSEPWVTPVPVLPMVALSRCLSRVGWEIDYVDIDLTKERPVLTIKCHRVDGLWIWVSVDELGRCTMERFHRQSWLGRTANTKGRWPQSPQIEDLFLGRMHASGPRSLLRHMCDYLTDNALSSIRVEDMRDAWRTVMREPIKLILEEGSVPREPDNQS